MAAFPLPTALPTRLGGICTVLCMPACTTKCPELAPPWQLLLHPAVRAGRYVADQGAPVLAISRLFEITDMRLLRIVHHYFGQMVCTAGLSSTWMRPPPSVASATSRYSSKCCVNRSQWSSPFLAMAREQSRRSASF